MRKKTKRLRDEETKRRSDSETGHSAKLCVFHLRKSARNFFMHYVIQAICDVSVRALRHDGIKA